MDDFLEDNCSWSKQNARTCNVWEGGKGNSFDSELRPPTRHAPPTTHTCVRKTSNNKTTINKFPLRGFSPCPVCHADSYFGGNNTKEELVYGRALAMSSFHFASNQSMASCLVMRWEMPTRFLQRRRRATRKPLRASTT